MASLEELRDERKKKLALLKEKGISPYPATVRRDKTVGEVIANFSSLEAEGKELFLLGRVRTCRSQGGLSFFNFDDGTGVFQGLIKKDEIGEESFSLFSETVDGGDFLGVAGTLFLTKRGEKTIAVREWKMLAKALRPLPDKREGLHDTEERLRRRYLDTTTDEATKNLFVRKSRFWQATREFLLREGGLEVETPVLELIPGGADAEPFKTHHNALDVDLYLRISPELHLKRLIVGGYNKVFEIGRIFRNEGMDREHLQDYTQMEMYWAYIGYEEMMSLVERLVRHVVTKTLGSSTHQFNDTTIDWAAPWVRIDYYEVFALHTGLDLGNVTEAQLKAYAEKEGIDTGAHIGRGRLIDVIFKKKVRPHLIAPGFLLLPPVDIEPLAKRWAKDQNRVERFQIVACGSELGKGFSELNDPLDQRARFVEQARLREAGDKEAQMMDEDFVEALEYGMPPTAGFAYSERLFAFLMNLSVRETVFSPLMKPR